ncbi:MAG: hypothetical protein AB7E55_30705 [Pigmentiphaga sp.]
MSIFRWVARAATLILDFQGGRFYVGWLWVVLAAAFVGWRFITRY